MGTLTRSELRDEVKANLGRLDVSVDSITPARYNRNLYLSQLRIARKHEWKEMRDITTVPVTITGTPATDMFLALPSLIKQMYGFRIVWSGTTYPPLIWLPRRQFDVLVPAPDELGTGRPTHYTWWGSTVQIYPVPDQNYSYIRKCTLWPADFANDAATSSLANKDDLIIQYTTHTMLRQLGRGDSATEYFGVFSDMLSDAIKEDRSQPDLSMLNRGVGDITSDGWANNYWADPFVGENP